MPERFFGLSPKDKYDALHVVASRSGRPAYLLEKDIWVVWTLSALFDAPFARHLVFKGGTSLSKGYQAIERFSEDVDVTYDIRAIAPDLAPADGEGLPPTRGQEQLWSKIIRERLEVWVRDEVAPILIARLQDEDIAARVTVQGDTAQIEYQPQSEGSGYVRPAVLLEFGARSTGEPFERRPVTCDAAAHLPEVTFPEASPAVMRPERDLLGESDGDPRLLPERPLSRCRTFLTPLVRHRLSRPGWLRRICHRRPEPRGARRAPQKHLLLGEGQPRPHHRLPSRPCVEGSNWFPMAQRRKPSPQTMPAWLLMDSCSRTRLSS